MTYIVISVLALTWLNFDMLSLTIIHHHTNDRQRHLMRRRNMYCVLGKWLSNNMGEEMRFMISETLNSIVTLNDCHSKI